MTALTPFAGMRMTVNAKVRPNATPMVPWLATSSTSSFVSTPVFLVPMASIRLGVCKS